MLLLLSLFFYTQTIHVQNSYLHYIRMKQVHLLHSHRSWGFSKKRRVPTETHGETVDLRGSGGEQKGSETRARLRRS